MSNSNLLLLVSVILLLNLYIYKKTFLNTIGNIFFFISSSLIIILSIGYKVADCFTAKGIDESVIYHLKYGLKGAGFSDHKHLILWTSTELLIGLTGLLLFVVKFRHSGNPSPPRVFSIISLTLLSLAIHPSVRDIYNLNKDYLSITTTQSASPANENNDFYDYYRTHIRKISNKNLNFVLIYAEGLERTYFNQSLFPGLINSLKQIEKKNAYYFTNIQHVRGTGWTIAGMVASQCGIPLETPSHGNSMSGMDKFLPSAICLGDILRQDGYHLTYMGGASSEFAGKGKFYKTHGFDEVLGYDELHTKINDKSYRTSWGLYDDTLFDLAYKKFITLSKRSEKFGLVLLTLDTHPPKGHPSKSCQEVRYRDGNNPMLNAVACSDRLITTFIDAIQHSPYANRTIVILVSDHIALWNTAYPLLSTTDRHNLFMIFDPRQHEPTKVATFGSPLDIGATLLPLLGYQGGLGLGRDLLSEKETESERQFIRLRLSSWKPQLVALWKFPKIKKFIEIDPKRHQLSIDDRHFKIPALVEVKDDLSTVLRFDFNKSFKQDSLARQAKTLIQNKKHFLLVDICQNLSNLNIHTNGHDYCLLAAIKGRLVALKKITAISKITSSQIKGMLAAPGQTNSHASPAAASQLINFNEATKKPLPGRFTAHRIAHAGGGINGETYTNSLEALSENYKKGFKYFEIDFSFTKDNHLVCLHDWQINFAQLFGYYPNDELSLREFEKLVKNNKQIHNCTLDSLAKWLKQHPSAFIITDAKERNIEALNTIYNRISDASRRIIPQIYDPENFIKAKKIGFNQVIWTLYRYTGDNRSVLAWAKKFEGPFAITMPKHRADSELPRALGALNIPSYVHTVNDTQEYMRYRSNGITEIYTDFLPVNNIDTADLSK